MPSGMSMSGGDKKVTARTLGLPSYASTITSVGLTIAHDPLSSIQICSLGSGSRSCLRSTTKDGYPTLKFAVALSWHKLDILHLRQL